MKTIQLTDEQYNALKNGESITIKPPKKKPWKPEKGQPYWRVEADGLDWRIETAASASIFDDSFDDDLFDKESFDFGNAFSSEENAKKASKVMRIHNKILQYIIENDSDWEAGWNDGNRKWYPWLDHTTNKWMKGYNNNSQIAGALYCSEQCCDELVELLNNGWLDE